MNCSHSTFLSIENATVKHMGKVVFQNLDFKLFEGQSLAVLAASGTESTAFLDTLLGKTTLSEGRVNRQFSFAYQVQKTKEGEINSFRDLMAVVSQKYEFRNKSNMQDFYYQQRFNASESEEAPTVEEYLQKVEAKVQGPWNLHGVMRLLQLRPLKDKSLIKLSNGESRRLAIAGALIKNPKLLLLDRPMTGLDASTRKAFGEIVKEITGSGIQVIMTTTPMEIPDAITHVGVLEKGKFAQWVEKEKFYPLGKSKKEGNILKFKQLKALVQRKAPPVFGELISMRNVRIKYGEKLILDQLNWKVKPGEYWALKGHNGAGKSTLLSLIFGENPQAYANDIVLFDRKRGTGESIWDIKKPTGFVSPEMNRYFPKNQNCLQVVLSGLFDTMGLFKKVDPSQEALAYEWLEALGIDNIARLRLNQVSLENQRFCLLARAMIKHPALLIMDEAAQGMDDGQRELFRETIDMICKNAGSALIYVSHYEEDIPRCVNRHIELVEGKVVQMQEADGK